MADANHRPSPEELLAQAGWLRNLARRLVGDGPSADDAVQETWLSALQSPGPKGGSARPWLAQVLRNVVRQDARSAQARQARERRLAPPEDAPAASDVVARAQGQKSLVAAVLRLEEPLRITVLRRYFDGLSSAAIAEYQGIPQSTVRNRLKRALDLLREEFESEDRHGLLALAGLSLVPDAATTLAPAATAILVTTAMKTTLGLGLIVLLSLGAWLAWESSRESAPSGGLAVGEGSEALTVDLAGMDPSGTRQVPAASGALLGAETAVDAAEQEPGIELPTGPLPPGHLEVLVLLDGKPVSSGSAHVFGGGFHVFPMRLAKDRKVMHHAPIGADGWARFQGLGKGVWNVGVEVEPGYRQYTRPTLLPSEGRRVVMPLQSTGLEGQVFDGLGSPLEGARVFIAGPDDGLRCITWTDVSGRYSLGGMPAGQVEVSMIGHGDYRFSRGGERRQVQIQLGQTATLDFGPGRACPRWTGAVRNAAGELVTVAVARLYKGSFVLKDESRGLLRQVQIADDGSFDIGMEPGTYRVEVLVGYEPRSHIVGEALVMPSSNLQRDVIVPGAVVRGQVLEGGIGFDPGVRMRQGIALVSSTNKDQSLYGADVDRGGNFVISGVAPGIYRVETQPRVVPNGVTVEVLVGDAEVLLNVELVDG